MTSLKNAFSLGFARGFQKFALSPPTQVDDFVAHVESGKDMPPGAPGSPEETPPPLSLADMLERAQKTAGPLEKLLATEKTLGPDATRSFYAWQQGRGAATPGMASPAKPPMGGSPKVTIDPGYARELSLKAH